MSAGITIPDRNMDNNNIIIDIVMVHCGFLQRETITNPITNENIKWREIEKKNFENPSSDPIPDKRPLSKITGLSMFCQAYESFPGIFRFSITSKYCFPPAKGLGNTFSLKNIINTPNKMANETIVNIMKNTITPNINLPLPIFVVPMNLNTEELFCSDKVIGRIRLVTTIIVRAIIPGNIYSILNICPRIAKRIPGNMNANIGP
ncbi:MAG: hypothetical protein KAG14_01100 [Mycoplasmataceae bacterium]|nr:hypothetical protein [Mycoplasmataceae bacterium]